MPIAKQTIQAKIHTTLLIHEYMRQSKLAEKLGVDAETISPALTKLRRKGFIEASGPRGDRRWKKHPLDNPLYPPQPDFVQRKLASAEKKVEVLATSTAIIDHLVEALSDLRLAITRECDAANTQSAELARLKRTLAKLGMSE